MIRLRMCFETDAQSEMTQIHLWQSYQATFLQYQQSHGNLIAGEFIKNVSNTFTGASAQVAHANKYVIRGIRPRKIAHDLQGKDLVKCRWRTNPEGVSKEAIAIFANDDGKECGEFFMSGEKMWEHILSSHLKVPKKAPAPVNSEGSQPPQPTSKQAAFDFAAADQTTPYACQWSSCTHRPSNSSVPVSLALLARHINTHLPSPTDLQRKQQREDDSKAINTNTDNRIWHRTISDEHNDAAGLPLGSALVLRNIARGVRKMAPAPSAIASVPAAADDKPAEESLQQSADLLDDETLAASAEIKPPPSAELMKKIFDPVRERLFFALAHNPTIGEYVAAVIKAIAAGGG